MSYPKPWTTGVLSRVDAFVARVENPESLVNEALMRNAIRERALIESGTAAKPSAPRLTVPSQGAALTVLKLGSVCLASVLFVWVMINEFAALEPSDAWIVVPAYLLGYLFADLLSGTMHWFCDTFFHEDTPVIGRLVIQPFRDHHIHPQRITHYRFLEQDTTAFVGMLPLLALAVWLDAPQSGSITGLFWCSCLLGLATGAFGTNLFHKWAHLRHPPRIVRWLQRRGLILSPENHCRHHRDHSRAFCVTSGWLNPVLDAWRFFPCIERGVRFFQP